MASTFAGLSRYSATIVPFTWSRLQPKITPLAPLTAASARLPGGDHFREHGGRQLDAQRLVLAEFRGVDHGDALGQVVGVREEVAFEGASRHPQSVQPARVGGGLEELERADDAQLEFIPSLGSTGGLSALEDAARRFGVDPSAWPRLVTIEAACNELPAFAAAHPDRQPDAVWP